MSKEIFRDLDADDPDPETTEIESLCMSCYEKVSNLLFFLLSPDPDKCIVTPIDELEVQLNKTLLKPNGS